MLDKSLGAAAIAAGWFEGNKHHFGIIGGDFNSQPGQPPMENVYAPELGGTGFFTEYNRRGASRSGAATGEGSRKRDYIFFSTNRAPIDGAAVDIQPDASDHHMVSSKVAMKK